MNSSEILMGIILIIISNRNMTVNSRIKLLSATSYKKKRVALRSLPTSFIGSTMSAMSKTSIVQTIKTIGPKNWHVSQNVT